jgi:CRISPR-associated protein Cas2
VTVIVVTACTVGPHGHHPRLLEISLGVISRISARDKTGRAIMVYSADNEQELTFEVHCHEWIPVDFKGIHPMLQPTQRATPTNTGWSTASKRRRYGCSK